MSKNVGAMSIRTEPIAGLIHPYTLISDHLLIVVCNS